ncbi:MAG TPA: HEPN domain-containing protein [Chitinophagaceae bacterium]|nr:HEPN domain-containing protein [Chitinophagaceae bacterium]
MTEQQRKDIIKFRLGKARETFNEVKVLVENEFWNTAVNRIYYACFYAVTALLIKNGLNTQTHAGTRQMFGLHFVKTAIIAKESGNFYTDIFDLRQTGDYEDFFDFNKATVLDLIEPANRLIAEIETLLLE